MSLGSAASLVEEPFPFSHTIRVESQSKNRSDYDLHHPKSHHPYMRKRERLWRLLHQHPSNHSCLRIFDVMVVLPEPFGPAITIRTGRCSVVLISVCGSRLFDFLKEARCGFPVRAGCLFCCLTHQLGEHLVRRLLHARQPIVVNCLWCHTPHYFAAKIAKNCEIYQKNHIFLQSACNIFIKSIL